MNDVKAHADGDDFQRIYDGCLKLPVMKAIAGLVCREGKRSGPESLASLRRDDLLEHELHFDFLDDFNTIVDRLRDEYDAVLGPRISLEGPQNIPFAPGVVVACDLDGGDDGEGLRLADTFEWEDSALRRASLMYRRECGWDFAPGEAGIWLAYCVLTSSLGGRDWCCYQANMVGFAILYDRDEDGQHESLGHMWTAKIARRKGVATQLLARARQDFPVRTVEGPTTKEGRALLDAVWPDRLARSDTDVQPAGAAAAEQS